MLSEKEEGVGRSSVSRNGAKRNSHTREIRVGTILSHGAFATLGIAVFGAANGMLPLERATLLVEWYGTATFGSHQGRLAAANGTARAGAPFVVEVGHHFARHQQFEQRLDHHALPEMPRLCQFRTLPSSKCAFWGS